MTTSGERRPDGDATDFRALTPQEVGQAVKRLRAIQGWTQDSLAALSRVEVRTIQRVERGEPSSLDTRRTLARAFGFEDIDWFNRPMEFPTEEQLKKQQEEFERKYLVLDLRPVGGRQLVGNLKSASGYRAFAATSTADLPQAAQDAFAPIVDFVRDCLNVADEASHTEMLGYGDTIDEMADQLRKAGFCLCVAHRSTAITSKTWVDQTSWPMDITYLVAAPKDDPPSKVAVLRKVSFGF